MKNSPELRFKLYVIGFYLLLLGVWQVLYGLRLLEDYLFPSPWSVARRLWELATDGLLWPSIHATLLRMAIGFSISAAIGLGIGLMMGTSR